MKILKLVLPGILMAILLAFAPAGKKELIKATGTYGVSNSHPVLQLKINENNTFQYIDETNPNLKFNTLGTWLRKGNILYLESCDPTLKIPHKWKLEAKSPCIKTRKGLNFIRICAC